MKIPDCRKCDLSLTRNNIVSGHGNPESEIMFIGEAPGYHEDKHGLPFVGKSGELLDYYLDLAGFERDSVYITNIVKCRPPSNRQPYVREIVKCLPYLRDEILTIRPRIVVCLGAIASSILVPRFTKIADLRGKLILTTVNIALISTYHPSYILQNGFYDVYHKDWMFISNAYKILSHPFHTNKFGT